MTAKFDKKSAGSGNVAQDIENARMRMIYEDPAAYAEWRIRMGLDKALEPRDNPAMRARVAALFHELGSGLAPPRSKRRPDYRAPGESLAEYGRQPLAVSDAFRAALRRPEAAE